MRPAGHSTSRAALPYQHAAEDRDRDVAAPKGEATTGTGRSVRARSGHAEIIRHPAAGT